MGTQRLATLLLTIPIALLACEKNKRPSTEVADTSAAAPPATHANPPSTGAVGRLPRYDDSTLYSIDLTSVRAKTIWYKLIGKRDLAILAFNVCDLGSTNRCKPVTAVFRIKNGQTLFPTDATGASFRLFGPAPLRGPMRIEASLTLSHPQKFDNVQHALRDYAKAQAATISAIGVATGQEGLVIIGNFMGKDAANRMLGNFYTEVAKTIGRVACAGRDPLTYSMGNANELEKSEVDKLASHEFKLISFHRGAQTKTCGREFVYDPIQGRVIKEVHSVP